MASNGTLIQIPDNVDDKITLRRVLDRIVQEVDELKGHRGGDGSAQASQLVSTATSLDELRQDFNDLDNQYIRSDGKTTIKKPLTYSSKVKPKGNNLVDAEYVDTKLSEELLTLSKKFVKKQTIAPLPAGATNAQIVAKINEIIDAIG